MRRSSRTICRAFPRLLHGRLLGEFSLEADERDGFTLVFPHGGIKIAYRASVLLVKGGVRHTHDSLKRVVVTE